MSSNVFQLIDFDRTLFDTTGLIEELLTYIARTDPELSETIRTEGEAAYKEERTFLLLRYLRDHYGHDWLDQVIGEIVREKGSEYFILPGARERLQAADELTTARPSWGLLTYGDVEDQLMKIRIAGLEDAPAHIVGTNDKGGLISSWLMDDGRVQLPEDFGSGIVDGLTFEDDKLRVFADAPESLIGVWLTNAEDAEARLIEAELPNVHIAHSLHESLAYLRAKLQ